MADEKVSIMDRLKDLVSRSRVTKVVVTRSIKTPHGDFFVGFSAAYDSKQCDYGGPGVDLMPSEGEDHAVASQGIQMDELPLARLLLAQQAELAALEHAQLAGAITMEMYMERVQNTQSMYRARFKAMGKAADR